MPAVPPAKYRLHREYAATRCYSKEEGIPHSHTRIAPTAERCRGLAKNRHNGRHSGNLVAEPFPPKDRHYASLAGLPAQGSSGMRKPSQPKPVVLFPLHLPIRQRGLRRIRTGFPFHLKKDQKAVFNYRIVYRAFCQNATVVIPWERTFCEWKHMAGHNKMIEPKTPGIQKELLHKRFLRKHGNNANGYARRLSAIYTTQQHGCPSLCRGTFGGSGRGPLRLDGCHPHTDIPYNPFAAKKRCGC